MTTPASLWARAVKRMLDIIGAIAGLFVLTPVMLIVAALIFARIVRPVLYREPRVGRGGKTLTLLKSHTLFPGSTMLGSIAPEDDPRITPIGLPLRRARLDELPQLLNVLIGDMSYVGPRPMVQPHADALDRATREIALHLKELSHEKTAQSPPLDPALRDRRVRGGAGCFLLRRSMGAV